MKIPESKVRQVKNLRDIKKLPLKKIKRETKLSMRQIKFILYERGNKRVNGLKSEWANNHRESPLSSPISPLHAP